MVDLTQRIHQESLGMNQVARQDPAKSSTTISFQSSIIAWAVWRLIVTVLSMVRMETLSQASMLRGKLLVVYTATTVLVATLCWIASFSAGLLPKQLANGCLVRRMNSDCAPSRKRSKSLRSDGLHRFHKLFA